MKKTPHFQEDDLFENKVVTPQIQNNPAIPPPIAFGSGDFEGIPEMDGLTTKSDKQVINIDENDSEDEGIDGYKIGGYHPVHIGEVILKRYVIIQKLGWGHFSTVWLSKDFKYNTYVALKIQKSAPHYLEAAYDEVEILQKVAKQASNPKWIEQLKEYYKDDPTKKSFSKDDCQVVQLLNSFIYKGPYGNHFCMVFEILGVNLLEIIKRYNYKGIPMHLARIISKQVLIGLDFLHRFCDVIHTDLKPENVLLCLTPQEITQIVEKGQLDNSKTFLERIKYYQKAHGIQFEDVPVLFETVIDEVSETQVGKVDKQLESETKEALNDKEIGGSDSDTEETGTTEQSQTDKSSLTKQQKKNLRRKAAQKRKKQQLRELKETNKPTSQASNEGQQTTQQVKDEDIPDEIRFRFDNWTDRGERLSPNVRVKIADLGNACWTHHHFATEIQTRQYRSPETIIGVHYNTSADIWSFACMIYEMLTGDFLFQPRKEPQFSQNDDHIAQIQELCNKLPKKIAQSGSKSKKYFHKDGKMRRIPQLNHWPLISVLIEKNQFKEEEAKLLEDFMLPMLRTDPLKRASARSSLQKEWIHSKPNYLFKFEEQEFVAYQEKKKQLQKEFAQDINNSGKKYIEEIAPENTPDGIESEDNDCDISDNDLSFNSTNKHEFNDDEFFGQANTQIDMKLVDRSFTNLGYIGYGEGIKFNDLDQDANWQFANLNN